MLSFSEFHPAMTRGPIHPDSKQALAERLRLLRTVKKWTQATAAKMIGENQATWGWWESPNNTRKPTSDQLREIELATGFPREWVQSGIAYRLPDSLTEKLTQALEQPVATRKPRKRRN